MIVIPRKKGESIILDDNIIVTVVEVRGNKVKIQIEYPEGATVTCKEVYDPVTEQSRPEGTEPWMA